MCTQINCFVIQQSTCIATNGSTVILALAAEISGTNGTVYEECQQCNKQIIASYPTLERMERIITSPPPSHYFCSQSFIWRSPQADARPRIPSECAL
mmetsp:Transcript_38291/g.92367  ORF Transcript_38291/g.92367 Transcript_38291/m.92367 type:complete len:97 (-) Transcript_38291:79-369(-)